jgi:hypothetical protein
MRYAFERGDGDLVSMIVAADEPTDFDTLFNDIALAVINEEDYGAQAAEHIPVPELMEDPFFKGFKRPPYRIIFADEAQRAAFYAKHDIVVCEDRADAKSRNKAMMRIVKEREEDEADDDRTIGEILGLTEHDPWDTRSDKQKESDSRIKKMMDGTSGDSFGGAKPPSSEMNGEVEIETAVTGIRIIKKLDGSYEIQSATAVTNQEGVDRETVVYEDEPEGFDPDSAPDTDMVIIDPRGAVGTYRKIDVVDAKLPAVVALLSSADYDVGKTFKRRNSPTGCWLVTLTVREAEKIAAILNEAGVENEVYAVSDLGERLVPKGTVVVEKNDKGPKKPRPWNELAGEIDVMDEEARKANHETYRAKEFYFVVRESDDGFLVHFTPGRPFRKTGEPWVGDLGIDHMLPADLKKVSDTVWRTRSRVNTDTMRRELVGRDFREHFMFEVYLNGKAFNEKD